MQKIIISEGGECSRNVLYVMSELMPKLNFCGASSGLEFTGDRTILRIDTEECYETYLRDLIVESVAEVICIGYKYDLLNARVGALALSAAEREILIAELIAADLPDDLSYVADRLSEDEIYQIDGFYHFRLGALRKKWERICDCIPPSFREDQLSDFVGYVMEDNSGMLYLKGGEVYTESYRKLNRSGLIADDSFSLIREIILSGASEVLCLTEVSQNETLFLQKYYRERVFFA